MNDSGRILACGHEICFDCTLDLMSSPIVHDGILCVLNCWSLHVLVLTPDIQWHWQREGESSCREGVRNCRCQRVATMWVIYSTWETAIQIDSGPTCKKMMDLKASDKVFKASAFEPSEDDIRNYKRNQNSPRTDDVESKRSAAFATEVPDELTSDSDDDLPDVAHMLDNKKNKGQGKSQVLSDDDDVRVFWGHCWSTLRILLDCDGWSDIRRRITRQEEA